MTYSWIHWCLFIWMTDMLRNDINENHFREKVPGLTGAGQPLSVGAELDRGDGFSVASQRELQAVVWFGGCRLQRAKAKVGKLSIQVWQQRFVLAATQPRDPTGNTRVWTFYRWHQLQTLLWLADADGTTGGFVSVSAFLSSVAMVRRWASNDPDSGQKEKWVKMPSLLNTIIH